MRFLTKINPDQIGDECLPRCPICQGSGEMGMDDWYPCGHFVCLITTVTEDDFEPPDATHVILIEHPDGFWEKLFFRQAGLVIIPVVPAYQGGWVQNSLDSFLHRPEFFTLVEHPLSDEDTQLTPPADLSGFGD